MDGVDDLLERRLERAADGELVDHLGGLWSDDVDAEDLAAGLVGDHLDEALGVAEGDRLSVGREGETPHGDLAATGSGRRLGGSDRGDLRAAIRARRDVAVVDRARIAS